MSDFDCPVCECKYPKRKLLAAHLQLVHPNVQPYTCDTCTSAFSSEKAKQLHVKRFHLPCNKRLHDEVVVVQSVFDRWVRDVYNLKSTEPLSASTIDRVVAFSEVARFGELRFDELPFEDIDGFAEVIHAWLDVEFVSFEKQTVNNHLRYLRYLVMHRLGPGESDILNGLDDLVANVQRATTHQHVTTSVLNMYDPYSLAIIRDQVVAALQIKQRDVIDPFIVRHLQYKDTDTVHLVNFGALELRCWLEISMRFCNVPMRVQCSRELVEGVAISTYVAKLVARDGQYCRLISQDKIADAHQPILLPLGRLLSSYLAFYLTFCRHTSGNPYVFQSKRGNKWRHISRDLKRYLTQINVPAEQIDPSGRFIHASRAIGIAAYAIQIDFDRYKLHGFATLLRHSSATSERFYSLWTHDMIVSRSIRHFSDAMGLDCGQPATAAKGYIALRLHDPPRILQLHLETVLVATVERYNAPTNYGVCSTGTQTESTQTDHVHIEQGNALLEFTPTSTVPNCEGCTIPLQVYGPYGGQRRKRYFGRYFLACANCYLSPGSDRFQLHRCRWFPLGITPLTKSNSARPRNLPEIEAFIVANS
jgi:hypothetical protein